MNNIRYFSPKTIQEAVDYLKTNKDAKILAGGTDLVTKWKKTGFPDMDLVDIRAIDHFADIKLSVDSLFIGAGAHIQQVQYSNVIIENFPILAEAAGKVGSVQVRNMATIGGNSCNAAPSADTVLPLIVYGAEADVVSANSEKRIPLSKFFTGPGKTILQQGELLKGFYIPVSEKNSGAAFAKHSRRVGMDLATVGVAVKICLDADIIKDIKIALGAVGPVPVSVNGLEKFIGAKIDDSVIGEIALFSTQQASPITDVRGSKEYRADMINENIVKCLQKAIANI